MDIGLILKLLSMDAKTAVKYDRPVPRYTSYPTAPNFDESVTGNTYADWLSGQDLSRQASLYLHVPYCDTLCWFCGCHTKIVQRYAPVASYLKSLSAEIDLIARHLPGRLKVGHVHWGGGSPTLVSPKDWWRMARTLEDRFDIADDAAVSVELDPRETTEEYIAVIAEAGVNRVSIGVQDFNPKVQRAINRIQPLDGTRRVADWLRHHGIEQMNVDLMYGLPHQTVGHVLDTIDKALTLDPQRVSLFGYAHVPWMKSHQKLIEESALPDAETRWAQAEAAAERLVAEGYVRIGFDHFAKPEDKLVSAFDEGRLRRNFQGYTDDDAPILIGLGASAIGRLPEGYIQNTSSTRQYASALAEGRLPVVRGHALTIEDRRRGAIIEKLMCYMAVEIDQGDPSIQYSLDQLTPLVQDGICRIHDGTIEIDPEARPLVRLVAAAFDGYLGGGPGRHARAV